MARIASVYGNKLYAINRFLGVNEGPAGDTQINMGEAAEMRNFRITKDGALQKRPGTSTIISVASAPIKTLWNGFVSGTEYVIAACDDQIWNIDIEAGTATSIGAFDTSGAVSFLGYEEKLYMLNGDAYWVWDGTTFEEVTGYRPLVAITTIPAGGGTELERVNMLNGLRRVWFSPDGTATDFQLPETSLVSIDYVKNLVTDENYTVTTDYTADLDNGLVTFDDTAGTENFTGDGSTTVFALTNANRNVTNVTVGGVSTGDCVYNMAEQTITFDTAPASSAAIVITEVAYPANGTDTIEIGYTAESDQRSYIEAMKYFETYNGTNDNRVFIYGDGTNKAYYSDLDYDGEARADYFPDLNVVHIGDANTPVTSLIRHYDRLLAYKLDSTYSISFDTVTLVDGTATAGFYVKTVNKRIGNCAPGQVQLCVNYPRSLDGKSVYEWKATTTSGNITGDQRNAKIISDRVEQTLGNITLSDVAAYADKYNHEYYILTGETAVIHNYDADAWYIYTGFAPTCLLSVDGELYGGTASGEILHISRNYQSDDGAAIDAYWCSGAMAFNADWMRKYLTRLFITVMPEQNASVDVTLLSNVKGDYNTKTVSYSLATFSDLDFVRLSFGTNRQPQTKRVRIKANKFIYLRLVFSSNNDWARATIQSADFKIRQMGDVK